MGNLKGRVEKKNRGEAIHRNYLRTQLLAKRQDMLEERIVALEEKLGGRKGDGGCESDTTSEESSHGTEPGTTEGPENGSGA